ncbi:hypothetical protein BJP27_14890 [Pseudomonas oryzihabitans]|nr:hypothetical protein BJP27_14890 [Pseudomonas psychrotolerans]
MIIIQIAGMAIFVWSIVFFVLFFLSFLISVIFGVDLVFITRWFVFPLSIVYMPWWLYKNKDFLKSLV